jgi:hypothetical protein
MDEELGVHSLPARGVSGLIMKLVDAGMNMYLNELSASGHEIID